MDGSSGIVMFGQWSGGQIEARIRNNPDSSPARSRTRLPVIGAALCALWLAAPGSLAGGLSTFPDVPPQDELPFDDDVSPADAIKIQQIQNLLEPGVPGSWGDVLKAWMLGYGNGPGQYADISAHAVAMGSFYNVAQMFPQKNNATLLPTLSPGVWDHGPIAANCNEPLGHTIPNYFKCKFLKRQPRLVFVTSHNVELLGVNALGNEFASNQGLYTFSLHADANGVPMPVAQIVHARFTFVYKKQDYLQSYWTPANTTIIQHHSSVEPGLPAPPMKADQIKALLTKWGVELEKWTYGPGQPHADDNAHANAMAALYTDDATLLPTVSSGVWKNLELVPNCNDPVPKIIANYFKCKFLNKEPRMIARSDEHVTFSPDLQLAANQGLYTFELKFINLLGQERRLQAKARFTFVYKKGNRDDWSDARIIMHHSSGEPGLFPFPGDVDGNGFVDFADITRLLALWRPLN